MISLSNSTTGTHSATQVSWLVDIQYRKGSSGRSRQSKEIEGAVYDLNAVNPNKKPKVDTQPLEELL